MPTVMVIPSGIGCSVGGYAGDAIPSARLLAAASGCLITHPNVVNGASLYWTDPRIHYVEGYSLDMFAMGQITLKPVRQNKIGLLFDAAIDPHLKERHLQVADACRASLGIRIGPCETTEVPLGIRVRQSSSGASWGEISEPDALIRSGDRLKDRGATAIAVITSMPQQEDQAQSYRQGRGVDPLAGAEAVISHLLVRHLLLPCAHAPALETLPLDFDLDPRAAGEEIGNTFLPCVLVGLNKAPALQKVDESKVISSNELEASNIGAIVVPEGAMGGVSTLACIEKDIPLIAVSNPNILDVSSIKLGLRENSKEMNKGNFYFAKNYVEAAGLLILLREGIDIASVQRPIMQTKAIDSKWKTKH